MGQLGEFLSILDPVNLEGVGCLRGWGGVACPARGQWFIGKSTGGLSSFGI